MFCLFYTFFRYTFCLLIRYVIICFVSLYLLSLYVLSLYVLSFYYHFVVLRFVSLYVLPWYFLSFKRLVVIRSVTESSRHMSRTNWVMCSEHAIIRYGLADAKTRSQRCLPWPRLTTRARSNICTCVCYSLIGKGGGIAIYSILVRWNGKVQNIYIELSFYSRLNLLTTCKNKSFVISVQVKFIMCKYDVVLCRTLGKINSKTCLTVYSFTILSAKGNSVFRK